MYVSLPLSNGRQVAYQLKREIEERLRKRTEVMVVDGDTTYSLRNLHLAPRRVETAGLTHFGGFLTFVIGRMAGLKARPTPIAFSDNSINPDWALTLAAIAHRASAKGAGRTVWGMSQRYQVGLTEVTWAMIRSAVHTPIIILRQVGSNNIS